MEEIATLYVKLAMDASEYARGMASVTAMTKTWAGRIGKLAKMAALAAVAGAAAAFVGLGVAIGDSINKAADLEEQLSGVGAVSGASAQEIAQLKGLISDLGVDPNLKVSSFEAADAMEMLARNGLTVDEIMEGAARSTILLANATGSDFSQAADIATDTMSLFNIKARDMDRAVDGITSVVNNSKFSIDDYRLALAQGGGVASAVGVEFADFNTAIAGIAPLFASGSDAGTSFKVMLQRLAPTSDKAKDMMAELGLITADGRNQFFTATGELRSMSEIAGVLESALAGLSEEQRNQALSVIFGTDAMRAAVGLAELGQKGFGDLQAVMGQTSAAENAAQRMDNLAGSMEILQGVVESIQLQIGDKFIPVVRSGIEKLTEILSNNADQIVNFFGSLAGGIEQFIANIGTGVQTAQGALAPFLQWWTTSWPTIQAVALTAWEVIKAIFAGIMRAMGPVVESLRNSFDNITQALNKMGLDWSDVWQALLTATGLVLAGIGVLILGAIGVIVGLVSAVASAIETMTSLWASLMESVMTIITGITQALVGASEVWNGIVSGDWSRIWNGFSMIIKGNINTIKGLFGALIKIVAGPLAIVASIVQGFVEGVTDFFQGLYEALVGGSIVPDMMNAILTIIQSTLGTIQVVVNTILTALRILWQGWSDTIQQITRATWNSIQNIVTGVLQAIRSTVDSTATTVRNIWEALRDSLISAWQTAWSKIESVLKNAINIIKGLFDDAVKQAQAFRDAMTEKLADLAGRAGEAMRNLREAVERQVGPIVEAFGKIVDAISRAIEKFKDWLGLNADEEDLESSGGDSNSQTFNATLPSSARAIGPTNNSTTVNNFFSPTQYFRAPGEADNLGDFQRLQTRFST